MIRREEAVVAADDDGESSASAPYLDARAAHLPDEDDQFSYERVDSSSRTLHSNTMTT